MSNDGHMCFTQSQLDSAIVDRLLLKVDVKMVRADIANNIQRITGFLCRIGFWHRNNEETIKERRLKIFYSFYYFLFIILIAAGAFESDDIDEKIFSVLVVLIGVVLLMKLLYLIWKKKEILEHFNQICGYGSDGVETINDKSRTFKKFAVFFLKSTYFTLWSILLVAPFVGAERKLLFHYGF